MVYGLSSVDSDLQAQKRSSKRNDVCCAGMVDEEAQGEGWISQAGCLVATTPSCCVRVSGLLAALASSPTWTPVRC